MKFKYYLLALITLFINDSNAASFMPDETIHLSNNAFCEIQNINVGTQTISFNGEKLVTDKVTNLESKYCDKCIKISFKGADLTVSQDQLLYLPKNEQWVAAKDLKPHDLALSINGDLIPVLATKRLKGIKKLYDLTIQDQHNLFISKLGILVHNEPVTAAVVCMAALAATKAAATVVATYAAEATVAATICLVGHELSKQSDSKQSDSKNTGSATQTQEFLKPYESSATLLTPDAYLQPKTAAAPKTKEASAAPLTRVTPPADTLQKKEANPVIQTNPAPATPAQPGSVEGKDQTAAPEKPVDEKAEEKTDGEEKGKESDGKKTVTVEELQKTAKESTKQSTKSDDVIQYEKPDDYDKAKEDFAALNPSEVKEYPNGTIVGKLPDGRTVNVRPQSDEGRPTLEIQNGKKRIKIRYG